MCGFSIVVECWEEINLENIECKYGKVDVFGFVEIFREFFGFKCKVCIY